ncbi:substrate-binding periplasmic protein [Pseudodesulfovibrio alkaliphilus]|nr:transporter substrate-binding domain-containing protein [Pseudodesulfovibrio alkaliphilus]
MSKITRRQALALLGSTAAAVALTPSLALADRQGLTCCWDRHFPPFSMELDGTMTGILVDCMDKLLGERMGYALTHSGLDWPSAQAMVERGQGDVLCTNPTPQRQGYVLFAETPVVESLPSIFCSADNPRLAEINAVADLDGLRPFRQVDYAGNGWATRTFPPDHPIDYVDSLSTALSMVASGEADIFVGNSLAALHTLREAGLKAKVRVRQLPVGEPSSFHFGLRAAHPDAPAILERFSAVQDQAMDEGVIREIILGYL